MTAAGQASVGAEPLRSAHDVSMRLAFGWGLGSLGVAILYNVTNILLLRYLVDEVGVAAALAAGLVAFSKIYDAITDPIIGAISDRRGGTGSRRRPWLLWGGLMCTAALPLLFTTPHLQGPALVAWLLFALLFYSSAYAIFTVPYMAMPSEMTDDPHTRSFIMSWRVKAIAIGQLLAGTVGPALVAFFGGGRAGHASMAWVMGILVLGATLGCYALTGRARYLPRNAEVVPFRTQARSLLANRPFAWLLLGKLLQLVGVACGSATLAFFTMRVLQKPDTYLGVVFAAMTLGIIAAAPVWTRISRRLGKRQTYFLGAVIYAIANLSWLVATPAEGVAVLAMRSVTIGIGSAAMLLIGQSLLPDVMAWDRANNGLAREGVLAGFYATIEKLSYALGIAIVGAFLGAFGYVPGATFGIVQPASALTAIRWSVSVLPSLFAVLAALAIAQVRIGEDA